MAASVRDPPMPRVRAQRRDRASSAKACPAPRTLLRVRISRRAVLTPITGSMLVASLLLVAGCSLATNSSENDLVVDFQSRTAVAARQTVRDACKDLPGVSVIPPRKDDVSVYFDISKASNAQQSALATCVSDLAAQHKSLGIRGYRFSDNGMS